MADQASDQAVTNLHRLAELSSRMRGLGLGSLPLDIKTAPTVDRLLIELMKTTEAYQQLRLLSEQQKKDNKMLTEQIEPMQVENRRLRDENNELHALRIEDGEEAAREKASLIPEKEMLLSQVKHLKFLNKALERKVIVVRREGDVKQQRLEDTLRRQLDLARRVGPNNDIADLVGRRATFAVSERVNHSGTRPAASAPAPLIDMFQVTEQTIQSLTMELERVKSERDAAGEFLGTHERAIAERDSEIRRLRAITIDESGRDIKRRMFEAEASEKLARQLEEQVKYLNGRLAEVEGELETRQNNADEVKRLRELLDNSRRDVKAAASRHHRLFGEIKSMKGEVESLQSKFREQEGKGTRIGEDALEAAREDMQKLEQAHAESVNESQANLAGLQATIDGLNKERETTAAAINKLKRRNTALEASLRDVQNSELEMKGKVATLQSEVRTHTERNISGTKMLRVTKMELEEALKDLAQMKDIVEKAREAESKASGLVDGLLQEKDELQKKVLLATATIEHSAGRSAAAAEDVNKMQAELETARADVIDLKTKLKGAEEAVRNAQRVSARAQTESEAASMHVRDVLSTHSRDTAVVGELEQHIHSLEVEKTGMQEQVHHLRREVHRVVEENGRLRSEAAVHRDESARLESIAQEYDKSQLRVAELNRELAALKVAVGAAERKVEEAEGNSKRTSEIATTDREIASELRVELDKLREEMRTVKRDRDDAQIRLKTLEADNDLLGKELNDERGEISLERRQQVTLQRDNTALSTRVRHIQGELETARRAKDRAETELLEIKKSLRVAKVACDKSDTEVQKTLDALEMEKARSRSLENEMVGLKAACVRHEGEATEQRTAARLQMNNADRLRSELHEARDSYSRIEQALREQAGGRDALLREAENSRTKCTELFQEVSQWREKHGEAVRKLEEMKMKFIDMQGNVHRVEDEMKMIAQQYAHEKEARVAADTLSDQRAGVIGRLEEDMDQLQSQQQEAASISDRKDDRIRDLEARAATLKRSLDARDVDVQALQVNVRDLTERLSASREQLRHVSAELASISEHRITLQQENAGLEARASAYEQQFAVQQKDIEELKKMVHATTQQRITQAEELKEVQKEVDSVNQQLIDRIDRVSMLERELEEVTGEQTEYVKHLRTFELQTSALSQHAETEKRRRLDAERQSRESQHNHHAAVVTISELNAELAALRMELSDAQLKSQAAETRAMKHAVECDSVRRAASCMQQEVGDLRGELSRTRQEYFLAANHAAHCQATADEATARLVRLKAAPLKFGGTGTTIDPVHVSAEEAIAGARSRVVGVEAERDRYRKASERLETELQHARSKNKRSSEHAELLRGYILMYEERLTAVRARNDHLEQLAVRAGILSVLQQPREPLDDDDLHRRALLAVSRATCEDQPPPTVQWGPHLESHSDVADVPAPAEAGVPMSGHASASASVQSVQRAPLDESPMVAGDIHTMYRDDIPEEPESGAMVQQFSNSSPR